MMRENLEINCCEYIAIYVASQKPEDIVNTLNIKYKLKIKTEAKLSYHLGSNYPEDPGETMVCQLKKCIGELHEKI